MGNDSQGSGDKQHRLTDRLRDLLRTQYGGINDAFYGELDRIDAFAMPSAEQRIAEPCQKHGCRFDVAQSLLDRAKERGELTEAERASVVPSSEAPTRDAIIEECAKLAEPKGGTPESPWEKGYWAAENTISHAIRALKGGTVSAREECKK